MEQACRLCILVAKVLLYSALQAFDHTSSVLQEHIVRPNAEKHYAFEF